MNFDSSERRLKMRRMWRLFALVLVLVAPAAMASPTVVDTHTHFFDPKRPNPPGRDRPIPWPRPEESIYVPTFPRDYFRVAAPLGITATVVVEASGWPEDNAWVLALAKRDRGVVGYVGSLTPFLGQPAFARELARLRREPLFRGIRIGGGEVNRALSETAVLDDLRRLAAADLSLDVLGGTPAQIAELAARVPRLRIVVDHMAVGDRRQSAADWRAAVALLAKRPNLYLKTSGLVEKAGPGAPKDPAAYTAALDHALATFGEDRLLFATNWPVTNLFTDLSTVTGMMKAWLATKPPATAEKIYWRNSRAVYRWVDRRGARRSRAAAPARRPDGR